MFSPRNVDLISLCFHSCPTSRDLKLENFLFSEAETGSQLKMIDFGLSKHFEFGEVQHESVGTPYTVAPEVILGEYDEKCDVWAIGEWDSARAADATLTRQAH